ncbi:hypothetical protein [Halobaculum limi]|uniref:hypothetical protein n=1 Tax=Halobaculum limi TaxID=3031916 RepID=UPI00240658EE|nr:hypothetical protein [Halobaculum sp. YSMS11]
MLTSKEELRISLWNALFAVAFTGGLAAGAGVAAPLLEFMQSQAFSLGDLGTVSWGLIGTIGSIIGAAVTNEFNYSEYANWQRVGLGAAGAGLLSVFLSDTVNEFVTSNVWIGVGVVLAGAVVYFVISVADAEGSVIN